MNATREIARRRTFAIISHPDAGKTTLTEKMLLYGGAVQLAGSVTARKNHRSTTSDWMEMEKQRGISVSSTVLQFEYADCVVNLLDTPGHRDFSEDTYRVLTAVDAAVMVIDAGNGIESQTRKLFEVCRRRGVPIFTFMNKLDRPTRPPLELLDELETVLGIGACAMNWPLGTGTDFRGVFDRRDSTVHLFERTAHGAYRAPESVGGLEDEFVKNNVAPHALQQSMEELEMLEGAGHAFDAEAVARGELTPVFFGSASNNFGVEMLLNAFLQMAPSPRPRLAGEQIVEPDAAEFSAFVFKIQANMDPRHRDRIYFVRIVSGKFQRDMTVHNPRTKKQVRLANSQRLFARERETVDEAYAGDVVGVVGNYDLRIGDTLSELPGIVFDETPRFVPECFAYLHSSSPAHYKRFREGLVQLLQEGVVQQFHQPLAYQRVPLLGAVGPLQFEVVQYRLQSEYNAESRLENAPFGVIRWLRRTDDAAWSDQAVALPSDTVLARDEEDRPVVLMSSQWQEKSLKDRNPGMEISPVPFALQPVSA
ncbi:MAG TPA: peptide chain release factor 3 [Verrucomicrobiales bacterium]|jgi:peptide chain release factor 3|nr:peptide chain release factor 3 [Verrucomicrobiales bacterium]